MRKSIVVLVLIIIIVSFEIFLRQYLGFCDNVLFKGDKNYEYIALPDQNRLRFRNKILYNNYSMRSDKVDSSSKIILGFGDSILNGGSLTDHDSLATTILSNAISKDKGKKVQFLNISMPSWGPDNCYAYLKRFGDFNSNHIVLFVSSHDAFDNMTFEQVVDKHKSYQSKQYEYAFIELFDRYLIPKIFKYFDRKSQHKKPTARLQHFNEGFKFFLNYSKKYGKTLTIYLHAEKSELIKNEYNSDGKEIIKFARNNNIEIIKDLEHGLDLSEFSDQIHVNEKGQRRIAERILHNASFLDLIY